MPASVALLPLLATAQLSENKALEQDTAACIDFEMEAMGFDRYLVVRNECVYPVEFFWCHLDDSCGNASPRFVPGPGEGSRTYWWSDDRYPDIDGSLVLPRSDCGGGYEYGACRVGREYGGLGEVSADGRYTCGELKVEEKEN